MTDNSSDSAVHTQPESPGVSGRLVVVGMFLFAGLMVAILFLYWDQYTRPYRELQFAIAEEFPKSSPRVVGGAYKSGRQGDPTTLRILIYVPLEKFNPEEESPERDASVRRLALLASQHQQLADYEVMEIRLMQKMPEQKWRRHDTSHTVAEWRDLLAEQGEDISHFPRQ